MRVTCPINRVFAQLILHIYWRDSVAGWEEIDWFVWLRGSAHEAWIQNIEVKQQRYGRLGATDRAACLWQQRTIRPYQIPFYFTCSR